MALFAWFKDGKIVVDAAGDVILCADCPCPAEPTPTPSVSGPTPTATPTVSGPTPTPTVAANDCNDCDPPLADTYPVTLALFTGNAVCLNGVFTVSWTEECIWRTAWFRCCGDDEDEHGMAQVSLYWLNDAWWVTARVTGGQDFFQTFKGQEDEPCAPEGTYAFSVSQRGLSNCNSSGIPQSAGTDATCVVGS